MTDDPRHEVAADPVGDLTGPATVVTDDGESLEARWSGSSSARAVAVLSHPHPRFGGDMDNVVPAGLARVLPGTGVAALRFNFRGTGRSTGIHGSGEAEVADVRAGVAAASAALPGRPVVGVGYSFGADVLLAVDDLRLAAVVAVAPPLSALDEVRLLAPRGRAPTLVLSAEHDQFRSFDEAAGVVSGWPRTEHRCLLGTDHFLAGSVEQVCDAVTGFVTELIG
jgi:uncharacterized protein